MSCAVRQWGHPRSSVVSLFLAPLGQIMHFFGTDFHCYANYLLLYMPCVTINGSNLAKLKACLAVVNSWLPAIFLQLNSAKMEMIVVGPARLNLQYNQIALSLDDCVIHNELMMLRSLSMPL